MPAATAGSAAGPRSRRRLATPSAAISPVAFHNENGALSRAAASAPGSIDPGKTLGQQRVAGHDHGRQRDRAEHRALQRRGASRASASAAAKAAKYENTWLADSHEFAGWTDHPIEIALSATSPPKAANEPAPRSGPASGRPRRR